MNNATAAHTKAPLNNKKASGWRVFGAVLGVLILLLTAALIWIVNDTERVRNVVENVVSAATDREFSIAGAPG